MTRHARPPAAKTPAVPPSGPARWHHAVRRIVPAFGAVGVFSAAVNVLMLTGSIYMLQVYDRVLSSGSVPTLVALFSIVVALFVFLGLFDALRGRLLSRAAHRFDADLGPGVCAASLGAEPAGRTALADLDTVRGFVAGGAMRGLFDMPFMPLFVVVLFVIHPWLGWLTLAGAGVTALAALVGRVVTAGPLARGQGGMAEARAFADGSRRAVETTSAMGMQASLVARWHGMQSRGLAQSQVAGDRAEGIAAMSKAFRMLLQSAILTLGAWLVIGGQMSAGGIIAASILSGRALAPIDQAIGQWKAIAGAREAWRRLSKAVCNTRGGAARVTELTAPTGRIEVCGLTKLAPGDSDRQLLNRVEFALEPGDGLGVIGSSACGKSSLARCLVGAWTPEIGEIRLDGATLDQWDPAVRGRHVGYLPQSVTLLPGTIRDNIARMDPDIDDEAVIAAARRAGIHEMILGLPQGYDTDLGPDAPPLSGGQMQRLGLARAMCGDPKIVVLDEPNANLDADGDAALTRAIVEMRAAGATVIVMAHRPSAIAAVNKVMVMKDGRVARFGDKDEIMTPVADTVRTAPRPKVAANRADAAPPAATTSPDRPPLVLRPSQRAAS